MQASQNHRIIRARRWMSGALRTGKPASVRWKVWVACLIFITAFTVRSIHSVDLAPVMYTGEQPMAGLTRLYDGLASKILAGDGLLIPRGIGPRDTGLLSYAPGYSLLLAAEYSVFGHNFFAVQFVQSLLTSFICVLLFLFGGAILSWRAGAVAGFLAAIDHSMAFYSNFITPDALCALPILLAFYFLVRAYSSRSTSYLPFILSGALLGVAIWLRPNSLLLALFVGVIVLLVWRQIRRSLVFAGLLILACYLVVAPITIRNYVLYHRFVPVSINVGIVMWEGIAESPGGEQFGAVKTDDEVGQQDVEIYHNPQYSWWASPDGIDRDHDRVARSLAIIKQHPIWYAGVMLSRMRGMLNYSGQAPIVSRRQPELAQLQPAGSGAIGRRDEQGWNESAKWPLLPGKVASFLRTPVRFFERLEKETMLVVLLIGTVGVFLLGRRRWLLIAVVPVYYLVCQSVTHTEFRYILPMQYFLFAFAGVGWVLIGRGLADLFYKVRKSEDAPRADKSSLA